MNQDNICVICDGKKMYLGHPCTFCNGTGEWNQAGENYLADHICQCIIWGREFCPVCGKLCHHDSSQTPKQKIDPGYGGMSNVVQLESSQSNFTILSETQEEEELVIV